jgi:predicted alpha/beta-hydrolase family hydrolase
MALESPSSTSRLRNGLEDGPASLLLAHGVGAPLDSPWKEAMALGLRRKSW